ncbi:uncharacterized protein LOC124645054 [Helicoverpa zea]|uniref:uncharacterized protein LOC124645054 n=1 Tax=Helicoverpa zea TaxID=7113 RepID=UPI001F5701CF|nr:uncharacterized protein LOC124645054 [Helicoverpa zea]
MEKLLFILFAAPWLMFAIAADTVNDTELLTNSTDPNKDMYVIHAMVYQVGILTNKTDNETTNLNTTGNQEAVTFYHTNGSQGLDLSKISSPLLTNVTAQSMVGVAPMPGNTKNGANQLPWSTLNHLANMSPQHATAGSEPMKPSKRSIRSIDIIDSNEDSPFDNLYRSLFKRDVSGEKTPVSIHSGSAVIPQGAHVQSIGIPPLLTLNNNMSNIPVPIPNTSVVHYSKINTLVTQP